MNNEWKKLFSRYYMMTHTKEGFHKKTFISNYKFIYGAIGRLLKSNTSDDEMLEFMQDLIEVHQRNYIEFNQEV